MLATGADQLQLQQHYRKDLDNHTTRHTATTVVRVRYAYADWPVCSLRNSVGGLPARLFEMAVVAV